MASRAAPGPAADLLRRRAERIRDLERRRAARRGPRARQADRRREREHEGGDQGRGTPTPKSRTPAAGRRTRGSSASRRGSDGGHVSTLGLRPAQIPKGIPIASATGTAMVIRAIVSTAASHTPSSPMHENPTAVRRSIRQPATRRPRPAPSSRSRATSSAPAGAPLDRTPPGGLLDRRQEVDEDRARRAALERPVLELVEPAGEPTIEEPPPRPQPHDRSQRRRRRARSRGSAEARVAGGRDRRGSS